MSMSRSEEVKALARKRAEQSAATQKQMMPAPLPVTHSEQEESHEPEKKGLRRKREKFLDKYSSQTFYVRNDLWKRAKLLMTERGDRTALINEALEEFLNARMK